MIPWIVQYCQWIIYIYFLGQTKEKTNKGVFRTVLDFFGNIKVANEFFSFSFKVFCAQTLSMVEILYHVECHGLTDKFSTNEIQVFVSIPVCEILEHIWLYSTG